MEENILDYDLEEEGIPVELTSTSKFVFFILVTFGLYSIWWMYKSWRFFQDRDGLDILPAIRAIFSIFFLYQLFEYIFDFAVSEGYSKQYSSGGLFIIFVVLNALSRLPDPYWFISFLSFMPLIQPFNALGFAISSNPTYNVTIKSDFGVGEIIMTVIGVLFWGLVLLGSFVSE